MRKALILACLASPASAQTYNYIPYTPPQHYQAPVFIPAQPIPMVPMPQYHPMPLLPYYNTTPQSQYQDDDNDN